MLDWLEVVDDELDVGFEVMDELEDEVDVAEVGVEE